MMDMEYSSGKYLILTIILSLTGLLFLWILIPAPVFNYLPLFLISYLIAIFLPGYTFISFVKPDSSIRTRLEIGVPLSLALLFIVTYLFLFLGIPLAFTYAVSVLLILSLILALVTYLEEERGPGKVRKPPRKPAPVKKKPERGKVAPFKEDEETLKPEPPKKTQQAVSDVPEEDEQTIVKRLPQSKSKLIPPKGEVEVIVPNHVETQPEEGKNKPSPNKKIVSPEKPDLKLPWIERQKELDRQEK